MQEIISSQEKILSQGRSCSSPVGTQRFVNESCSLEVAKEGAKEFEQTLDCSVLQTEIEATIEDKIIQVVVKDTNDQDLVASGQEAEECRCQYPDMPELFDDQSVKVIFFRLRVVLCFLVV